MSYPVRVAIGSPTAGQVIARVPLHYLVVARDKLQGGGGVCRVLLVNNAEEGVVTLVFFD